MNGSSKHSALPVTPPATAVAPHHLLYLLFTSGSTGTPKGVLLPHRSLVNHMVWMQRAFPLTGADRVLQKTPVVFDAAGWELWLPLLTGARLVLARPDGHRDPAYLIDAIQAHGITVLQAVPSLWRVLAADAGLARCRSLTRVFSGGEALSVELRDTFFERLGCGLNNLYGPTETAVAVTFHPCQRSDRQRSVPIGRPLPNTRIYVLDPWLEPVPLGVPGELHVGGVQVGAQPHLVFGDDLELLVHMPQFLGDCRRLGLQFHRALVWLLHARTDGHVGPWLYRHRPRDHPRRVACRHRAVSGEVNTVGQRLQSDEGSIVTGGFRQVANQLYRLKIRILDDEA